MKPFCTSLHNASSIYLFFSPCSYLLFLFFFVLTIIFAYIHLYLLLPKIKKTTKKNKPKKNENEKNSYILNYFYISSHNTSSIHLFFLPCISYYFSFSLFNYHIRLY